MEDWQHGGFGIYLHWPFCQSKCPYCDFNSHVAARIDQTAWRDAFVTEVDRLAAETPGRVVRSVFFGGGTPSLMQGFVVGDVIEAISRNWTLANDVEITLEANPGSVEAGRFADYRAAGVNRVSLGLQALNDGDLRRLGRLHSVDEGRAALRVAMQTFDRVSFDLIYARQDQSLADWRAELAEALTMADGHLSMYQLTIEEGTAFGDRFAAGKLRGLPDEDLAADFYDLTQEMTEAAGYPAYEVSNHAIPGQESRHNLIYWRAGDFLGIGPGAHGRITLDGTRYATDTARAPLAWLAQVQKTGNGEATREALSPAECLEELLVMGLRVDEGVALSRLRGAGSDDEILNKIKYLIDASLLEFRNGALRATARGRPVLNRLIADVAAQLE